jgi:TRAP-type C4-dicarboxylate transport system permease small subunit
VKRLIKRAIDAVGVALFALLFVTFIVQIVARFVFGKPLPWTDELAVILYIWVILWAAAFMVPAHEHVVFDLVYNAASPGVKRVMRALIAVLIGGLFIVALPASYDYVSFMRRESTPVLQWSFMWVFMPFVVMLAVIALRSVRAIVVELRGTAADDR